jgi:hypothetical protein
VSLTKLISGSAAEVLPGARLLTLDEAFAIACRIGTPEIGGAWNGKHAAELKLGPEYSSGHYINLKCCKHATAAENLMECVRLAESVKAVLSS